MNRLHRWLCRSTPWKATLESRILPWVLDRIDLGSNVLELGPGPGLTTDVLRVDRLTCVEIDSELAAEVSRRTANGNVRPCAKTPPPCPFLTEHSTERSA